MPSEPGAPSPSGSLKSGAGRLRLSGSVAVGRCAEDVQQVPGAPLAGPVRDLCRPVAERLDGFEVMLALPEVFVGRVQAAVRLLRPGVDPSRRLAHLMRQSRRRAEMHAV